MTDGYPYHHQFEDTLRHCHEQAAIITAHHGNYLQFIDDLKSDLDNLSCQVSVAQEQFGRDDLRDDGGDGDGPGVGACNEVSFCNERGSSGNCDADADSDSSDEKKVRTEQLQEKGRRVEAKSKAKAKAKSCCQLGKKNEGFQCQIQQLQLTICEKEKRITQLNTLLTRLSQIHMQAIPPAGHLETSRPSQPSQQDQELELQELRTSVAELKSKNESLLRDLSLSQQQEHFLFAETRKLHEELMEAQRKYGDLHAQTNRLLCLLRAQEEHRMELVGKYELMETNYEEQAQKLHAASVQLSLLQDRHMKMENRTDEHNMERNLLREEVLALKEKEVVMLGRQRSVQEQLVKLEKELCAANKVIKEQQDATQRNELASAEAFRIARQATNDTKVKFNLLVEDYNRLREEYEKQLEVRKQNDKVIESFRKWKEAQLRSDEATRASFKQYEEHIKLLLEEKQKFLEKYRELKRDYCIMQSEVDRLRHGAYKAVGDQTLSDNSITTRLDHIRRTSRRLSEKSASLRDSEYSSNVRLSRSKSAQDLL